MIGIVFLLQTQGAFTEVPSTCLEPIRSLAENPAYQAFRAGIPKMVGPVGEKRWFKVLLQPGIEALIGLKALANLYARSRELGPGLSFQAKLLRLLHISYDVNEEGLQQARDAGPLMVVSNHPFGIADGMSLLDMIKQVRPDSRLLSTTALAPIPEMNGDDFILMEIHGSDEVAARAHNGRAFKKILGTIKKGGVIIVFPSGSVARYSGKEGRVVEADWNADFLKLVFHTKANVLPIFTEGQNSFWYHIPNWVTARIPERLLRYRWVLKMKEAIELLPTARLTRELFNKSNRLLRFRVGDLQRFDSLRAKYNPDAPEDLKRMAADLRQTTLNLGAQLPSR